MVASPVKRSGAMLSLAQPRKANGVAIDPKPVVSGSSSPSAASASTSPSKKRKASNNTVVDRSNVDERILEARRQLPITTGRDAIVQAVLENDTIVVLGETGSGKTTQIPQYLYEAGLTTPRSCIGITQPRRVAATSLAQRVALEMGCPTIAPNDSNAANGVSGRTPYAGNLVGYSVRFDDRAGRKTKIKYMTDGWLLREMVGGGTSDEADEDLRNLLPQYSVMIVDEAHERTLRTDQVLGMLRRIQRGRKRLRTSWEARGRPSNELEPHPLKVIVMSATLDAERFARFFSDTETKQPAPAPVLYVKGRQHTVDYYHATTHQVDYLESAFKTVIQVHVTRSPGDILVFLPGQDDIESLSTQLQGSADEIGPWAAADERALSRNLPKLLVVTLYSALGPSAAASVFKPTPPNTRKVVLATNIAETSLTIPGIKYVIDCGLAKEKHLTTSSISSSGVASLQLVPISQSSARQRAGRAGRERAGEVYRLYTRETYDGLSESVRPEITRTDLADAALSLYALGLDPKSFDWIDKPDEASLASAVYRLMALGAITEPPPTSSDSSSAVITLLGTRMAQLPLSPSAARTLLSASDLGPVTARQARDLVAILSSERGSLFHEPADEEGRAAAESARATFVHRTGDHATLLNVLYAYLDELRASRASVMGTASEKEIRARLKKWCNLHYISERAVQETCRIREQLKQVCLKCGIVCDDDQDEDDNEMKDGRGAASMQLDDPDEPASDLVVSRGGKGIRHRAETRNDEDYAALRRALMAGRRDNVAIKQENGAYLRPGSKTSFRPFPTSCLPKATSAIVFEELMLTSASSVTYARCCSTIDPSWLMPSASGGGIGTPR